LTVAHFFSIRLKLFHFIPIVLQLGTMGILLCTLESKKVAMNIRPTIIGAIIGDMVGSFCSSKDAYIIDFKNLPSQITVTQDTLIVAEIAEICRSFAFGENERDKTLMAIWIPYGRRKDPQWPNCFYSKQYIKWCNQFSKEDLSDKYKYSGDPTILLRTIPIAFYYKSPDLVMQKAEEITSLTASDMSEIQAAKTIALAIHLAYNGKGKESIAMELYKYLGEDNLSSFGLSYNPVEMVIKAFMASTDFESAIRNAILLGQDVFNLATLTGALAAAYYNEIPEDLAYQVRTKMSYRLQRIEIDFFRKHRKRGIIKVEQPPKICPLCGSRVVRISYGYIPNTDCIYESYWRFKPKPLLEKDKDNERCSVLGGCCVTGYDPKWSCVGCEVKFTDVDPPFLEELIKNIIESQK
jgi:ADP-ribosylglycohydrolase